MRNTFKKVTVLTVRATDLSKNYSYLANRRNGYIAIDQYSKWPEGEYRGYCFIGNATECANYLQGLIDGICNY